MIGPFSIDSQTLFTLLAVAVAWGQLHQRLRNVEAHGPKVENIGRFEERLDRMAQDVRDLATSVRDLVQQRRAP